MLTESSRNTRSLSREALIAAGICAALLLVFWVRAQVAIAGKSSTYDEPMHATGAWVHRHQLDFRINYEDPPLWHYWAALPNGREAIQANFAESGWTEMPRNWSNQWTWSVKQLYRTEGNDGERFVQRSRSMMIVLGVALGGLLCGWAWWIGRAPAAVAAGVLFCFDPNFLAHAPLVKNDVAISLALLGLLAGVWRMGLGVTPWNLCASAVACAAAMTTKFTGVVLAPAFLVILLTLRALWPAPWTVLRWTLDRWWKRLTTAAAIAAGIGLFGYVAIWAAYGFRFSATPDPEVRLNIDETLRQAAVFEAQARAEITGKGSLDSDAYEAALLGYIHWYADFAPHDSTTYPPEWIERARQTPAWKPPGSITLALGLLDKRLAPEAWLNGLLFVKARSYIRGSYLDGEVSIVGFTSYFPKAMLYKTPLGTLGALAAALVVAALMLLSRRAARGSHVLGTESPKPIPLRHPGGWWLVACLAIPGAIYMVMSMASNLNIGLRHVLPVYPMIFLGVSAVVAWGWSRQKGITGVVAGVLGAVLVVESVAIAPDYLTFFNRAAGGQRGGLDRLGDSNLDWGQDLPAVAAWQARNPGIPLYFSYFGMVDPAFYNIRYLNMPGGYMLNPQAYEPPAGSVVAVSATNLQGVYMPSALLPLYQALRDRTPTEVLNGTIYIYDLRKK